VRPVALDAPAGAVLRVEPGANGRRGWSLTYEGAVVARISARPLGCIDVETVYGHLEYRPHVLRVDRGGLVLEHDADTPIMWASLASVKLAPAASRVPKVEALLGLLFSAATLLWGYSGAPTG
jgi:hypothetical protein